MLSSEDIRERDRKNLELAIRDITKYVNDLTEEDYTDEDYGEDMTREEKERIFSAIWDYQSFIYTTKRK